MNRSIELSVLAFFFAATVICGVSPASAAVEEDDGFESIFNGKDLTGWDGDPRFWSIVDGAIRGQTTAENPTQGNTFCVCAEGSRTSF